MARVQRSNINLSYGETHKEFRWINIAKSGSRIIDPVNLDFYLNMNEDQYPTTSGGSLSAGSYNLTFTTYAPGATTYVVKWRGFGSITMGSWTPFTNSNKTVADYRGQGPTTWDGGGRGSGNGSQVVLNGRMTFTVTSALSSSVTVKSGTSEQTPSISDLVICRLDEEDAFDSGQTFRNRFIELVQELNPGSLRFMDSQDTVFSCACKWEDRPSLTKMTWTSPQFINDYKIGQLACVVGSAGVPDVYTGPSYTGMPVAYEHGEFVHCTVGAGDTSQNVAPTLNVGGRGAKVIKTHSTGTLVNTGSNGAQRVMAGGLYTFTYDLYVDAWLILQASGGCPMGHPIEMEVALCEAAGLPGWFNIPFVANDDWITNFANYLVANYTQDVVYIEFGNEIWNLGFPMTFRAKAAGIATFTSPQIGAGSGADYSAWYGLRTRQISEIMRPIFAAAGQASKVKIIMGCSTIPNPSIDIALMTNFRFQNTNYAALSGANAPIVHSDIISYAMYFAGTNLRGFQIGTSTSDAQWGAIPDPAAAKNAIDDWVTGVATSNQTLIDSSFDWAIEQMKELTLPAIGSSPTTSRFLVYNDTAVTFDKDVHMYENHSEMGPPSTTWAAASATFASASYGGANGLIGQFMLAFYASRQYREINRWYLDIFYSYSKSKSGSIFAMTTGVPWLTFPQISPTDALGGDTTLGPYQNWEAHRLWNNGKRRLRLTTS